jgi:hypothetical protein
MAWENEFRKKLNNLIPSSSGNGFPLSIKIKVEGSCFHREHSPNAYRIIDEHLRQIERSGEFRFEEHESGPELLFYVAFVTAGISLASNIISLVTAIINARKKEYNRTDDSIILIARGFNDKGNFKEEIILRISRNDAVDEKMIEDALKKSIQDWYYEN